MIESCVLVMVWSYPSLGLLIQSCVLSVCLSRYCKTGWRLSPPGLKKNEKAKSWATGQAVFHSYQIEAPSICPWQEKRDELCLVASNILYDQEPSRYNSFKLNEDDHKKK